jgi:hypothetical protein
MLSVAIKLNIMMPEDMCLPLGRAPLDSTILAGSSTTGTNTPAYFAAAILTKEKGFVTLSSGGHRSQR